MALEYCEHNRRSFYVQTLYGTFRAYSCALGKRRGCGGVVSGFSEPCVAECTNYFRKPNGERGHSFPYKWIDFYDIPFDEKALRQIEEDKAERKAKAQKLRDQACDLIAQAGKLEKE